MMVFLVFLDSDSSYATCVHPVPHTQTQEPTFTYFFVRGRVTVQLVETQPNVFNLFIVIFASKAEPIQDGQTGVKSIFTK